MSGTRVDLLQSLETVAALDSLPLPDHAPAIEAEAVAIDYQVRIGDRTDADTSIKQLQP